MAFTAEQTVWSKSQVSAFHDCLRKGYFSLPPKKLLAAGFPVPWLPEAERLKKLRNRHLWSSSVLHESIGGVIKDMRRGVETIALSDAIHQARERMRNDFKLSRDEQVATLFEHHYNAPLDSDVWKRLWSTVEGGLTWFYNSLWFSRLQRLRPEAWKVVDELLDFDVGGVKAFCKIDCAVEVEGRFFILDWKSSRVRPEDERGLLVSALYAHEVWEAGPESIQATAVSLLDGRTQMATVHEEALMETYLRIQEEAAQLEARLATLGQNPFDLNLPDPGTCRRCNFQALCHPKGLES